MKRIIAIALTVACLTALCATAFADYYSLTVQTVNTTDLTYSQLDDSIYADYSEEGVRIPSRKVFDGTLNIRYHYDLDISPDWNINKLNVARTFYYPNDTHINNGNTWIGACLQKQINILSKMLIKSC